MISFIIDFLHFLRHDAHIPSDLRSYATVSVVSKRFDLFLYDFHAGFKKLLLTSKHPKLEKNEGTHPVHTFVMWSILRMPDAALWRLLFHMRKMETRRG